MIRFRRGTSLLNKVVKTFERAVADLDVAIAQIEEQRQQVLVESREMVEKNRRAEEELAEKQRLQAYELRGRNQARENDAYMAEYSLYLDGLRAQEVRKNIAALVAAE